MNRQLFLGYILIAFSLSFIAMLVLIVVGGVVAFGANVQFSVNGCGV